MDESTRDTIIWCCFGFSAVQALGVPLYFFGVTWDKLVSHRSGAVKTYPSENRFPRFLFAGCILSTAVGLSVLLYGKHPIWFLSVLVIAFSLIVAAFVIKNPKRDSKVEPLSSLQSDILHLSRDLRLMLKDAGPKPEPQFEPMKEGQDQKAQTSQWLDDTDKWQNAYSEWARKIIYRYREEFAGRVKSLMNSLGLTGMVVAPLEPYTTDVRPGDDFTQLIDLLMGFFVQLENPKQRPLLSKMLLNQPATPPLFTPLQIELFTLAKELQGFVKEMGEKPEARKEGFDDTRDGAEAYIRANLVLEEPWLTKLSSLYNKRYLDRLRSIINELGVHGLKRNHLSACVRGGVRDSGEIQLLIETLVSAAHQLDGIYVFPRIVYSAEQIRTMAENDVHRKIAEEPGFLVSYEEYLQAQTSKEIEESEARLSRRPKRIEEL
jgi:hypothetical protein